MASYHFSAQPIGRAEARSVVAAASYRAGELIERDETGDTFDYRRKSGVISADLLTPENVPDWARDRSQLWNAVEKKETRKNSRLAREIKVTIPHELSDEVGRLMVLQWAYDHLVSRGMCADVCIHDPDPGEYGNRNKHAHILCTDRELTVDGWASNKNRDWNSKDLIEDLRKTWAEAQNVALADAGSTARVDHRSLEAQRDEAIARMDMDLAISLDRPPEPRLGVVASSIERRAMRSAERRGIAYEPVTDRGADLAAARSIRFRLLDALRVLKTATFEILKMTPKPLAVQEPENPETETGPSF